MSSHRQGLRQQGLILISAGTFKNIIRILCPLVITDEQLNKGLDILENEITKSIFNYMKPFAIAGIQMKVSAVVPNVEMMKLKLDITMNLYPWVEMVVFSELCAYGPLLHYAQEVPGLF